MPSPNTTDYLFLKSNAGAYSYAHLYNFTAHFKAYLDKKGFQPGIKIGILASSSDEVIFLVAACWLLDIPFICFIKNEKSEVLKQQIKTLKPAIIFTDEAQPIAQPFTHINELPIEKWRNSNVGHITQTEVPDENIFGYFFTSGTTSNPKIVPLKRRQMKSAANASARNIKLNAGDFWLLCMPLYHVGGASIILRSLIYHSAIYRVDSFTLLPKIISGDESVKVVSLVPTMLKRLLDDRNFKPHSKFKILLGGGPVYASLLEEAFKKNIPVITSYGMTETCAQIAAQSVVDPANRSVGIIFEPNRIQIRDAKGEQQMVNKSGTIWLKGPQVFDGYLVSRDSSRSQWPNCKRDKSRFTNNGWFNTGDFGRIDDEHRLYIEVRRTDLIITGGENVAPTEIEEALLTLNGIAEAAVIGLPDEEWGQIVAAALVVDEKKHLGLKQIKQQLNKVLPAYKIPKKIVFVDALPRTNTGKVKRDELNKLF